MTALHVLDPVETASQRKARLQQECLDYRSAISHYRREIRNSLGMKSIAKSAIDMVGQRAQSALGQVTDLFDFKNLDIVKVRRAIPVLLSAYSLLSRRALLSPVLRGATILCVAGTGLYFYSRKKTKKQVQEPQSEIIRHPHPSSENEKR